VRMMLSSMMPFGSESIQILDSFPFVSESEKASSFAWLTISVEKSDLTLRKASGIIQDDCVNGAM